MGRIWLTINFLLINNILHEQNFYGSVGEGFLSPLLLDIAFPYQIEFTLSFSIAFFKFDSKPNNPIHARSPNTNYTLQSTIPFSNYIRRSQITPLFFSLTFSASKRNVCSQQILINPILHYHTIPYINQIFSLMH